MDKLGRWALLVMAAAWVAAGCTSENPDVRRGNLFFQNKEYDAAYQAYEKAVAADPKVLDQIREKFKKSYYYYGGSLEMGDSLDGAIKYYEKGFALDPTEAGICEKLAKYFWERKEFEPAAKYYARLIELDGEAPDTSKKWAIMGQDYYALGYAQFQSGKFKESVESFQSSLKVSPSGKFAGKCKQALEAARAKAAKTKGE